MKPTEALKLLGATRVIWIDDHFGESTAAQLASLLKIHLETARKAELGQFEDLFARIESEDPDAGVELEERLTGLEPDELKVIRGRFFAAAADAGQKSDLTQQQILSVCTQLNIVEGDRWPFEGAAKRIQELCAAGDSDISYIIDLNDAYGATGNTQGLELLKELHANGSKATALLLTNEATATNESVREQELRQLLAEGGTDSDSPVCVIAKERLEGNPIDDTVAEGLRIAIKRAGLRRSVHEVLVRAKSELASAYDDAMTSMLQVPPEQLDVYVVGRAYAEGVSELHVVERALTASLSESFRNLFSTDSATIASAQRLRALREVPLNQETSTPHPQLEAFRRKEIWEPRELANKSLSPLACGDVFEFDPDEGVQDDSRKFILLVQPCDVTIRPKGARDSDSGFLVPMKLAADGKDGDASSLKQPPLPFLLDGKQWVCDFRRSSSVRLNILDLATLRTDGKVTYDSGMQLPAELLPGQEKLGKQTLNRLGDALKFRATQKAWNKSIVDLRTQLTLSSAGPFQEIAQPTYVAGAQPQGGDQTNRFTWKLRRAGRVRMPYSAAILSNYLAVLDREAFDLDYLKPEEKACGSPCEVGEKTGA